jgi:predicted RNA-binding Zn-ribbon protein involved in translation (DUF1610 family)
MEGNILYKFAQDDNGNITHINNTSSNVNYYCPECKEKFILKKGNIRKHHFAHMNTSNCTGTGEGYLHKTFKKMFLEKINENLNKNIPMYIFLKCNYCNNILKINILPNNTSIKEEYDLTICRPDIALLDEKGNVITVFEIVVSHKPENGVIKYYNDKNILLIQINIFSENDLINIDETINKNTIIVTRPDYFNVCMNPNCISKRKIYRRGLRRSRRL